MRKIILIMAFFTIVLGSPATLRANLFIVDQEYTGATQGWWWIWGQGPSGQEFTPTFNSLNGVELTTRDQYAGGGGVTLYVDIRQGNGTVFGTSVGRSSSVVLSEGFSGVTHFDFPSPVALVKGNLYVIAPVVASGEGGWLILGSNTNPYPRGHAFLNGEDRTVVDFWFREGPTPVPIPSAMLLLGSGLIGLAGLRRKFRK